jgi:hypothetical protein
MPTDRDRQRVGCGIWNENRAQCQKLRRRPAGRSQGQQHHFADEFLTGAGSKHAQIMRSGTFCLVSPVGTRSRNLMTALQCHNRINNNWIENKGDQQDPRQMSMTRKYKCQYQSKHQYHEYPCHGSHLYTSIKTHAGSHSNTIKVDERR